MAMLTLSGRPRAVALVIGALVAAWLIIANSAAFAFERIVPLRVAAIAPWGSDAWSTLADRELIADNDRAAARRAETLAREALGHDVGHVSAIRTLGEALRRQGRVEEGRRLAAIAQQLSWRDLPTRVFAARDALMARDGAAALRHYSAAMLTSRAAWPQMMPALVNATADPALARDLAPVLARQPQWIDLFYSQWIPNAPRPETMPLLSAELDRLGRPVSVETRAGILGRLVSARQWRLAADELRRGRPAQRDIGGSLADGYAHVGQLRPFDWEASDRGDVAGVFAEEGGRMQLIGEATSPGVGEIGRRLLLLRPGSYRVSTRISWLADEAVPATNDGGVALQIVCADSGGFTIAESRTVRSGSLALDFAVPANCPAQWLFVRQTATDRLGETVAVAAPTLSRRSVTSGSQ